MDKQTEMMLQMAATLTAEDLDSLRSEAVARPGQRRSSIAQNPPAAVQASTHLETAEIKAMAPAEAQVQTVQPPDRSTRTTPPSHTANPARGEYERQRTRESKVSTVCVGREREKHDWWPVGIELVGHIGSETFTAMVVENVQVKSGRSILITSGPASGKVCITPTRAAIEATEHYRRANNLGRSGGITNGWEFWSPRA